MQFRKILSLLVAVTMLFSCVGITAMAETVNTLEELLNAFENGDGNITLGSDIDLSGNSNVAKIGDKAYATLAEAAAAAKSGDIITMIADATIAEKTDVTIPDGVTLNGNGYSISASGADHDTATSYGYVVAGGNLTIKGITKIEKFSASYYDHVITIGEGASLEVFGKNRVSVGYGSSFYVAGTISDAKTANKSEIQPSLNISAGLSIVGGNDTVFEVKNAYVILGDTSSKNSNANAVFDITFENSIVDFTKQFAFAAPKYDTLNPTFNVNVKDSVLTTGTKLYVAAPGTVMTVDNSTVSLGSYLRNSGELTLKNGSVLTGGMIQFGDNGGNDGTIFVDASTLTINNNDQAYAMDGKGTGKLILKNGSVATIDYIKDSCYSVDKTSTLNATLLGNCEKIYVAKIGETTYETLEAALKALKENDTLTLLTDITVDYYWDARNTGGKITLPVTIDGNGHKLTFTNTVYDAGNQYAAFRFEKPAVVKNLTIDMTDAVSGFQGRFRAISSKDDLTVDNCTFIGNGSANNTRAIIFGEGAGAAISDVEVSVTNSTFTGWKRGVSDNENAQDAKSVVISGNTFTDAEVNVSATDVITFTDNTVSGKYVKLVSYTGAEGLVVTATGNTLTENVNDENMNFINVASKDVTAQKEFYIPFDVVAKVGEESFGTVMEALEYAVENGASEIKVLKDSREVMTSDFEITIKADLTITADEPVNVEFYNDGTTRDFTVNSTNNSNNYKFTIAENVHFDLVDRVIWLGYYGNDVDVQVDGYLGGYQIWHGADTTISTTGTLDSHGEAFIMRRDAVLTVNGGKVNANYLQIYSGHINAKDADITAGLVWINNNHSHGVEGTVSIALDNSKFVSNDVITTYAGTGKTVNISLTNNSTITTKQTVDIDASAVVTTDVTSTFTAKKITGSGKIVIDATDFNGEDVVIINADMSGFTGEVEVANNSNADYKIENGKIILTKRVITGSVTCGYAENYNGFGRIWGQATANAKESIVLKLYSGEKLIATTMLNDRADGQTTLIDGKVHERTWSFLMDESQDDWWITTWESGHPSELVKPDKVVLYVDGAKLDEDVVKMTSPDNLHPIEWKELIGVNEAILPNAEVTNLGMITVTDDNGNGDYSFGSSYWVFNIFNGNKTTSSDSFDMNIAMEFIAKDTKEEAEANAYAEYTTDFFIKIEGLEDNSFIANGCYLAGYYPSFNAWVKIPLDGFEIENGKVYPVISSVGFDFSYVDICASVQDFICGIYLTPEVLEANPNINVNLALGLSENIEAAQRAEFTTVDDYTYNVDDFEPAAKIGDKKYSSLTKAIAAAEANDIITLLKDIELEETVTVPAGKEITLELNGKTITGTDNNTSGNFYLIDVKNGADFTVKDSIGAGKITLTATNERNWSSSSVVIANEQGTLTVEGGTIEHLGGTSMAYAIDNLTNGGGGDATTTITGGTINSTYFAVRQFANSTSCMNTVVIKDNADVAYVWMQSPNNNVNTATTIISGGIVDGLCVSGRNADYTLSATASSFVGDSKVYGTMPAGKELTETNGTYSLTDVVELFEFVGASPVLGNSLEIDFYVAKNNFNGEGYYAVIEHDTASGVKTQEIPMDKWSEDKSGSYYLIEYFDVTAKQIGESMKVTIYDSKGKQVSVTREDGIKAYAERMLNNPERSDKLKTTLVDMLNYGAAAQKQFGYRTDMLANADLTDEQKAYASEMPELLDERVIEDESKCAGSSLVLRDNILLDVYFSGVTEGMYAEVKYTKHSDTEEKTYRYEYEEFETSGRYKVLSIDTLVIADAKQLVTITVYDKNGNVYTTYKDSMNSYLARQLEKGELPSGIYGMTAKFTASSYKTLH